MDEVKGFSDLVIWQRSMDLAEKVYQITKKLPAKEDWGLISQLCRAAVSVPSNIAEGYGRQASGEYRHHLLIARGSLMEVETQIILCQRLNYLSKAEAELIIDEIQQICRMFTALISKIKH